MKKISVPACICACLLTLCLTLTGVFLWRLYFDRSAGREYTAEDKLAEAAEIIRENGEDIFRDLETRVLAELGKGSGAVTVNGRFVCSSAERSWRRRTALPTCRTDPCISGASA